MENPHKDVKTLLSDNGLVVCRCDISKIVIYIVFILILFTSYCYFYLQVPPAELEALLISHSAIEDAAVIGVPDARAGELPKAFVVKKANEEITEEEIMKYIEERVAPHKNLRGGVEFIDKIPRSLSGKILRRELKEKVTAELKNLVDNRTKEEEENVISSKNPDVEIPDNLSWTEFIFQHFDEYEDREAIVSCITGFQRLQRTVYLAKLKNIYIP